MSTLRHDVVPKSDLDVLNQHIDDDKAVYRVRAGQRVHYLYISTTVFDESTLCRPHLLIPELPDFPATDWTRMDISREGGMLQSSISFEPLQAVRGVWHPKRVDILSLPRTKRYRSAVHEVVYQGRSAISKIACFDWNIRYIEHETWAYSILDHHQQQHPDNARIAPEFLAHLTENGRVIGMLLEKINGDFASREDMPECEATLRGLHAIGLIHGDINRYNFVVDPATRRVRMVDFEHAGKADKDKSQEEMASLPNELAEGTDRGRANS